MKERIALGFHTCVDYELEWNTQLVRNKIKEFNICDDDLKLNKEVDSERDIWIVALAHLRAGIGCEILPNNANICLDFAYNFEYKVTMGGTPTRAAIILSQFGVNSILQTSCYNSFVRELLPDKISIIPGTELRDNLIYPHIVLQCAKGIRIKENDIDFTVEKENRILISRDEDSMNMPILTDKFGAMIKNCDIFLLGSFTEIIDFEILKDRIEQTKSVLSNLKDSAIIIMEDGCYIKEKFRVYVHEQLASYIDVLSMNEDEMQQYLKKEIDILDSKLVSESVKYIQEKTTIKNIVIHSAKWALIFGEKAEKMKSSIVGGVNMAATRFRKGDKINFEDYKETKKIANNQEAESFCKEIIKFFDNNFYCIPCKDLSFVTKPTVVGLGDSFVGGFLLFTLYEL